MARAARNQLGALAFVLAFASAQATVSSEEAALWNTHTYGVFQSGAQAGKVVKFGSGASALPAYVAVPAGGKPEAAVVIFSDVYGWQLNNTRLFADRLAKAGYLAVLPDFFRGDVLADYVKKNPGDLMGWIKRQPNDRVVKDFDALVPEIKKTYPSVKKIAQYGFCWGGLFSALLSSGKGPKVDAAVAFHPSLLTPDVVAAITGPVSFQAADPSLDSQVNATFYQAIEKEFAKKRAKGIPAEIKAYKGQPHGFALRGNVTTSAKAASDAFDAGIAFLKKNLAAAPAGAAAAAAKPAAAAAKPAPAGAGAAAKP
ncbi:hypothetical protein Rsub_03480 [Raphidocelis subcapitata]|uniref:Dienelactone hydrolase domain-containing protein n=1 Tax=Raphidocelis subcapitata TaxID=307507 RepID=A0A2V0NS81_9CHLO|nr:hypothetical protein Rsub_03480 [Raphidocelis subcapitata]|eukprot:GBF90484.1 hypothetical protein Rsub_03480 [Raphidocelis subcapitata]